LAQASQNSCQNTPAAMTRQRLSLSALILLVAVALALHSCFQSFSFVSGHTKSSLRQNLIARTVDKVEDGVRVTLEYHGTIDEDGAVFDTTEGREPVVFIMGDNDIMEKMEDKVMGMEVGETRDAKFGEDAPMFGVVDPQRMLEVPFDKLPPDTAVGAQLMMREGMPPVTVVAMGEESATLDCNHPLAGKPVSMKLTVTKIEEVPESEKMSIEVTTPGDGKTYPKAGDTLTMHYVGTLAKGGAQFDSSRDRDEPFSFQIGVGQVIQGWDKGVLKLSLGERAILRIPSHLGYGARGAGEEIPPYADLVFDVELLKIN